MQLIYRGEIFDYNPCQVKSVRKPRALNWRYHVPGFVLDQNDGIDSLPQPHQPCTINWRYQLISQAM